MSDQKPGQGSKPVNEDTQRLAVANRIEEIRSAFDTLKTTKSGRVIRDASDLPDDPGDWPAYILWPLVPSEKLNAYLRFHGITDERVLSAVCDEQSRSFSPWELQIAPLSAAEIAERLALSGTENVLHVGTGSGFQAAVLAQLTRHVVTMEIDPALAEMARANLQNYENVTAVCGDGIMGHSEAAPYDVIVLAAATPKVPPELWEQLNQGGTIAVPMVMEDSQELQFIRKMSGSAHIYFRKPCRFDRLRTNSCKTPA